MEQIIGTAFALLLLVGGLVAPAAIIFRLSGHGEGSQDSETQASWGDVRPDFRSETIGSGLTSRQVAGDAA